MINLKFLDEVFHELFDGDLSAFVYAGKFIGVIIFMLTIGKELFKNFAASGKTFGEGKEGFTPYTLIRGLIILIAIVSITEILTMVDKILLLIEQIGESKWNAELKPLSLYEVKIDAPDTGSSALDIAILHLRNISDYLNPMVLINKILYIVFWILDLIIFSIFVAKRFFYLGLLKLFSPIILGLSILPEYRLMSYNLGKIYLRNFLSIIPFILVIVFANRLHDAFISTLHESGNGAGTFFMSAGGQTIRTVALVFTVILKIVLFKSSSNFLKDVIN